MFFVLKIVFIQNKTILTMFVGPHISQVRFLVPCRPAGPAGPGASAAVKKSAAAACGAEVAKSSALTASYGRPVFACSAGIGREGCAAATTVGQAGPPRLPARPVGRWHVESLGPGLQRTCDHRLLVHKFRPFCSTPTCLGVVLVQCPLFPRKVGRLPLL